MSNPSETGNSSPMARALKEGLFAGVIAFGMFLLFVGIETYQDINNALVWRTRWGLLAIFVAVAAIGRFVTVGFIQPHIDRRKLNKAKSGVLEISDKKSFFHKHFLKIALVLLLIYPFLSLMIVGKQGSLKYVDNLSSSVSQACSISAMSPSTRSAPIPMPSCLPISAFPSGFFCRCREFSQPSGGSFSASRFCA
jgi:branched-chain amino acid transport system permease protein